MHGEFQQLDKKLINDPVVSCCLKMGIYDWDMNKAAPVSPYRHAVTLAIRLLGRIMEMEQKVHLCTAGFFDNLLTKAIVHRTRGECTTTATEVVVNQINNKLAQLDKDIGTINSRVNHHRAEIDDNCSQLKITEGLVSDLVCHLEVLEERDVLREGWLQSLLEDVERLKRDPGSKGKGVD